MNFSALKKADIANGPGFRITLWCSGCLRKCPGCFNPEAQNPDFGKPFTKEIKDKIFRELESPQCSGLSLMGGEPLSKCSDNRRQMIQLCRECKERFPDKSIYLWSGYTFEEIAADPYMKDIIPLVDVIVDGPFLQEKRDLSCPLRGSTNQRVVDVKKTLKKGSVVEVKFS